MRCMKDEWRKYLGARMPRYTSYPSALAFTGAVGAAEQTARLGALSLYEPLSLYVHAPFCRSLCWYCGCNMRVENRYDRALRYVSALQKEFSIIAGEMGGAGRVCSVHFGGGTPNYFKIDEIADILAAIESEFGLTDDTRLAIELDPRLVDDDDVAELVELGFGRISVGVQDFNADVQRAINRMQDYEMVERVVSDARAAGVDDLSFDILYGLPRQTLESFDDTLTTAIALAPDRISMFGYAHAPAAAPRQRLIDESLLPDAMLRAELALLADRRLIDAGYRRVGFDHYARPENALAAADRAGRLKRNFQGFTDDPGTTTIGFGVSAISTIGDLIVQNEKSLGAYYDRIAAGASPTARGVVRSPAEMRIGAAIMEVLCRGETDLTSVFAAMCDEARDKAHAALVRLEADGLATLANGRLRVPAEARLLSRLAASAIDPSAMMATATERLAPAV
jgi:oxygen-independent coproporphyrinogen-3 oxidase